MARGPEFKYKFTGAHKLQPPVHVYLGRKPRPLIVPLTERNGEVTVTKPADPQKLKEYQESKGNNHARNNVPHSKIRE